MQKDLLVEEIGVRQHLWRAKRGAHRSVRSVNAWSHQCRGGHIKNTSDQVGRGACKPLSHLVWIQSGGIHGESPWWRKSHVTSMPYRTPECRRSCCQRAPLPTDQSARQLLRICVIRIVYTACLLRESEEFIIVMNKFMNMFKINLYSQWRWELARTTKVDRDEKGLRIWKVSGDEVRSRAGTDLSVHGTSFPTAKGMQFCAQAPGYPKQAGFCLKSTIVGTFGY